MNSMKFVSFCSHIFRWVPPVYIYPSLYQTSKYISKTTLENNSTSLYFSSARASHNSRYFFHKQLLLLPSHSKLGVYTISRSKSSKKRRKSENQFSDDDSDEDDDDWVLEKGINFKDIKQKVTSVRIDIVAAAGFGMSRRDAEKEFYGGKLLINGQSIKKKSVLIYFKMSLHQSQKFGIFGLILARKGSKGIKNKNLALLNGVPLIASAIRVMKRSNCFVELWVSTDDEAIERVSREEGAFVHKRAPYTAVDDAPSILAVKEFMEYHPAIDNICLVQCTSPFLKENYLKQGLDTFLSPDSDTVFSVTRRYLLRWSQDPPFVPENFDLKERPSRQTMRGDICENGMFYFSQRKFICNDALQGGRCNYVEIPEEDSLDIDTPLHLFLAEKLHSFKSDSQQADSIEGTCAQD